MAIAVRGETYVRAVIFDFDEALLVRAPAWRYTVEEAVASVTGRRVDASPLAEAYRGRPWRHALEILLDDHSDLPDCEDLCQEIFTRSAMKKLLVHEGVGMALDGMRGALIEVGAISHEPHAVAVKQVHSTGLDRLIAVLAATPINEHWDPSARMRQCLAFLEHDPSRTLYVGSDPFDLRAAEALQLIACEASWAVAEPTGYGGVGSPLELQDLVLRSRS